VWTLLIRLEGPMQSWGTRSRFDDRDTEAEPSKSGVLGLLCAAAGIDRADWASLEPLTRMRMGVRLDRPGVHRTDFQTAQLHPTSAKTSTAITKKHYLADASFVAGLESEDRDALLHLHQSLKNPHYPLCLGRKSFLPGEPCYIKNGVVNAPLESALANTAVAPLNKRNGEARGNAAAVVESAFGEGSLRQDVPIAAFAQRRYGARYVKKMTLKLEETTT
jgi:CRISPR system Cascade subunit CasD